ncbi:MAG: peptide ABC transporter substrate-binding protein [Ardenticatenales bacterium]|nr:peptide ABC transporter substrate-binding protein [Ardenticatenales bacterium]
MSKHIRWQLLFALGGMMAVLLVTAYLSTRFDTVRLVEAGGSYREAIVGAPTNLNPLYLSTQTDRDISSLLFNRLTRPTITGDIMPDLATDWTVARDGRRYTFTLRADMRWHDGTPFTATDVAYTVGVLQSEAYTGNPAFSEMWRSVTIEVLNPTTIAFLLPEEIAPFAPFLSFTTFYVLPAHLLRDIPVEALATSDFSVRPIGTGPWRVERVAVDEVSLVPNADYPATPPILSRFIFRFFPTIGDALAAYRNGEVLGIADVPPSNLPAVVSLNTLSLYPAPVTSYTAMFFNLDRENLQTLTMREALVGSIDRAQITSDVLKDGALPDNAFLMPMHWAYPSEPLRIPSRPDVAATQLDEMGWLRGDDGVRVNEGRTLRMTLLVNEDNAERLAVAEAIAQQWEAQGIRVELRALDPQSLLNRLEARDFDAVILSPGRGNAPADPDFYPLWHSSQIENGQNIAGFNNELADQLLVEARRTLDREQRAELYDQFQQLLATELPALPLYHSLYNYAVNEQMLNVTVGPLHVPSERFTSLPDWSLRTKRYIRVPANSVTETAE